MRVLSLVAAMGVCGLIAANASAQLIVGNDQTGTATIYHVDVITGVSTPIYSSTTTAAKPWGMAYDPGTNTLWWNNGSTLFSSPFDIGGLTPTNHGTMMYNAASVNFVGLGFDADGNLVGTRNIATEAVYKIDTGALTATLAYQYPSAYDFGGLDVDAATNILYGLSDTNTAGLYKIDVDAQTQSFLAGYPAGQTDIDGLAVYNDTAYYVTDGPLTSQPFFYIYDVTTGTQTGTLPSPFTGSGTFCAGAFISSVPAPGTLCAIGMLGLAGLGRKRRN